MELRDYQKECISTITKNHRADILFKWLRGLVKLSPLQIFQDKEERFFYRTVRSLLISRESISIAPLELNRARAKATVREVVSASVQSLVKKA